MLHHESAVLPHARFPTGLWCYLLGQRGRTADEPKNQNRSKRRGKPGALEEIPTGSPSAILKEDAAAAGREEVEKEAVEEKAGDPTGDESVIVSGGRKVTVIQVNRSLTKVSLADAEEDDNENPTR
ncbi:unnamed protein product [Phytophthora lilii]|uniref:Unnamed protein product n=1 Tax=Phytophthora lilii TaxID=2077276 RepID=A0A9W6U226_9STRA|nr:unnamed protein product [Phytophthora lilii]